MENQFAVIVFTPVIIIPAFRPFLYQPVHHYHHHHHHHHHHHLMPKPQQNRPYRNQLPETNAVSTPVKSIWKFPENDHLKLNTDGSSRGNPGPSSYGGLIRDGQGRWICGYMGKMNGASFTSLEAEVWSVYKGLCLIRDKNLSNLVIETDCGAILMLQAQGMDDNHPLKSVVEAIETIRIECKCTMIIHTKRDGNHCADQLAKLGGQQSEEYTVLEEPPAHLIPYLFRDVEAAVGFKRNPH